MSEQIKKIGILISGRGSNMEALIKASIFFDYSVAVVISDNKDAPGLMTARDLGIDSFYIDPIISKPILKGRAEEKVIDILNSYNVKLVALAGFMRIVKKRFISSFDKILNIHPSLLPCFPGLDVHRRVIESGVRYTGCTVHFVNEGIDTGPIIMQSVVKVDQKDTEETIAKKVLKEEHRIYPLSVNMIINDYYEIRNNKVILDEKKLSDITNY